MSEQFSQQFSEFASYTEREVNKAIRSALGKAARLVRKKAKANLGDALPKAKKRSLKFSDKLVDAIRISKYNKDTASILVHTMGTRKADSGTFRTKFFESGTAERVLKRRRKKDGSPWKTGSIKALRFFDQARSSESEIQSTIDETLTEAINRINQNR